MDTCYVFVEDIDRFSPEQPGGLWQPLLEARTARGLPAPDTIAWLDGVECGYFRELAWPDEPCDPFDARARARRAGHLRAMPPDRFRAFALLLSGEADESLIRHLEPSSWFTMFLAPGGRLPAYMLPDFDIEAAAERPIVNVSDFGSPDDQLKRLREAFSLNHVPDVGVA